jgi:hypothetical protein
MTRAQLRPFVIVAWIGVLTTFVNTVLPLVGSGPGAARLRDAVLLLHAPATLFPVVGLALLLFTRSPFAAVVAIAATTLEKALELVGQTLALFPPAAGQDVAAATWDRMYFVLWCCNTAGATCVGVLLLRQATPRWRLALSLFAPGAALLTAALVLAEYLRWTTLSPPGWLFAVVFTGYRLAVAVQLPGAARPG